MDSSLAVRKHKENSVYLPAVPSQSGVSSRFCNRHPGNAGMWPVARNQNLPDFSQTKCNRNNLRAGRTYRRIAPDGAVIGNSAPAAGNHSAHGDDVYSTFPPAPPAPMGVKKSGEKSDGGSRVSSNGSPSGDWGSDWESSDESDGGSRVSSNGSPSGDWGSDWENSDESDGGSIYLVPCESSSGNLSVNQSLPPEADGDSIYLVPCESSSGNLSVNQSLPPAAENLPLPVRSRPVGRFSNPRKSINALLTNVREAVTRNRLPVSTAVPMGVKKSGEKVPDRRTRPLPPLPPAADGDSIYLVPSESSSENLSVNQSLPPAAENPSLPVRSKPVVRFKFKKRINDLFGSSLTNSRKAVRRNRLPVSTAVPMGVKKSGEKVPPDRRTLALLSPPPEAEKHKESRYNPPAPETAGAQGGGATAGTDPVVRGAKLTDLNTSEDPYVELCKRMAGLKLEVKKYFPLKAQGTMKALQEKLTKSVSDVFSSGYHCTYFLLQTSSMLEKITNTICPIRKNEIEENYYKQIDYFMKLTREYTDKLKIMQEKVNSGDTLQDSDFEEIIEHYNNISGSINNLKLKLQDRIRFFYEKVSGHEKKDVKVATDDLACKTYENIYTLLSGGGLINQLRRKSKKNIPEDGIREIIKNSLEFKDKGLCLFDLKLFLYHINNKGEKASDNDLKIARVIKDVYNKKIEMMQFKEYKNFLSGIAKVYDPSIFKDSGLFFIDELK